VKYSRIAVLLLIICLAAAGQVWASSLFPLDNGGSMFADRKARNLGDLVTVIIVEQAQARQSANTSTGKDSQVQVGPGLGVLADLIPLFGMGGGDSFTATGQTTRGGSLTAKVTTKVVEVLPNDTLRIEGRQSIVINGEEQEIILRGIVRSQDIAADNTVLSPFVADAEISFVGTGIVADKNNPGIITRIFNWLF
jgi:flagellar L-ring protein precursor FlgH